MSTRYLSVALLILIMIPIATPLLSLDYYVTAGPLKDTYKQNEELEVVGLIFNNRSLPMIVISFNVIVESAQITGRNATIYANITKDINIQIGKSESFTGVIRISLRNFLPDKYNITAFFRYRWLGEELRKDYVIEDAQIRVKPYVEIPPIVMVILAIMIGILIVFVGYGLAGILTRRRKKKG